jgi:hypothetical protein
MAVITFVITTVRPLHWCETSEYVSFRVKDESQSIRTAITALVEIDCTETITIASSNKWPSFRVEFFKQWWKLRNNLWTRFLPSF